MKIALATCRILPEPDVDEPILLEALTRAGMEPELAAWDDPAVDWSRFDACVVRSTWNYYEAPADFAGWIKRVDRQTRLINPAQAMLGNIDKRYLLDLAAAGVSIVPTVIFEQGNPATGIDAFEGQPVVVKPIISAGSWRTKRFTPQEFPEGLTFLNENLEEIAMMIQLYMPSVEHRGESSWAWIDGEITHGVRKSARFDNGYEDVSEAVFPTDEDRALCANIMRHAPADLTYARIDLIQHEGDWLLSELELLEPSLFLKQNPQATDRLVRAIQSRIALPT